MLRNSVYFLRPWFKALFLLSVLLPVSMQAQSAGDSKKFKFTGVLMVYQECIFNKDQPIIVDFGNVAVNKVDSGQYIQPFQYTIECASVRGNAFEKADNIALTLDATPVAWLDNTMPTSAEGLGVRVLHNGKPLSFNTPIDIDPDNPPALEAQLVKEPSVTLTAQPFSATATLIAYYK